MEAEGRGAKVNEAVIWGLHKRSTDGQFIYCPRGINRAPQWVISAEKKDEFLRIIKFGFSVLVFAVISTAAICISHGKDFFYVSVFVISAPIYFIFYFYFTYVVSGRYGRPVPPGSFSREEAIMAKQKAELERESRKIFMRARFDVFVFSIFILLTFSFLIKLMN